MPFSKLPVVCQRVPLVLFAQYILRTENPEKVPNIAVCRAGIAATACGPGFFDAATPPPAGMPAASSLVRHQYASSRGSGLSSNTLLVYLLSE